MESAITQFALAWHGMLESLNVHHATEINNCIRQDQRIDDAGFPKLDKHSVGVTRQYCGMLGKEGNRQAAASLSLARDQDGLPVAWLLYRCISLRTIRKTGSFF